MNQEIKKMELAVGRKLLTTEHLQHWFHLETTPRRWSSNPNTTS